MGDGGKIDGWPMEVDGWPDYFIRTFLDDQRPSVNEHQSRF
jgi:hypothetical protein